MRRTFIYLFFILLIGTVIISSCEAVVDDIEEGKVIPEVNDSRFAKCYFDEDLAKNKCDSVLISFFGIKAYLHLKLNNELSFIGCDEGKELEMLPFGDDKCCLPRTYDLVYDMIIEKDTICQIPMVAGSEMKFDFISEDEKKQLAGYAMLLEGKIKFDYSDLRQLMKEQKMNPNIYEIELERDTLLPINDTNAFFWNVSFITDDKFEDVTKVNAMTGAYSPVRPSTKRRD